jgi:hypothetical protein
MLAFPNLGIALGATFFSVIRAIPVEPTLTRIELHTHIARLSTEDGIRYATRQATRAVERFARAPMARLLPFVGKRSVDAADSTDILVEDLRAAEAIQRAVQCYRQPAEFIKIQLHNMSEDYSWNRSAKSYIHLYQQAIQHRKGTI